MSTEFVPLLHGIKDAAKRLGVSESTVWRLLRSNRLRATYVMGRTTISEAELQRLVRVATEGSSGISDSDGTELGSTPGSEGNATAGSNSQR